MAGGLGRLLTSRQVWRFQLACRVPAARLNHVDAVQIAATSSAGPCPACRGFFMRRAQLLPASTSGHSGRSREHRRPLPKPETAKTQAQGVFSLGLFMGEPREEYSLGFGVMRGRWGSNRPPLSLSLPVHQRQLTGGRPGNRGPSPPKSPRYNRCIRYFRYGRYFRSRLALLLNCYTRLNRYYRHEEHFRASLRTAVRDGPRRIRARGGTKSWC